MKKKTLVLITILVLAMTLMTGCGNKISALDIFVATGILITSHNINDIEKYLNADEIEFYKLSSSLPLWSYRERKKEALIMDLPLWPLSAALQF